MPAGGRTIGDPLVLEPGDLAWPAGLARLGTETPARLALHGDAAVLRRPLVALFCSERAPGGVVIRALDVAAELADAEVGVLSGFQSPVEREVLVTLLSGVCGIVICPARALRGMAVRERLQGPLRSGRLAFLSAATDARRPTAGLATRRNRLVAALSSRVVILHASPGGRLWGLAREVASWGTPLSCLDHPANADLQLLGAAPMTGYHGNRA